MNRAMFSGVAGLKAHQTKMDVIGNNIANVNTYGYKSQRAIFSDIYYQTVKSASGGTASRGGTNPSAVGYGSSLSAVQTQMTQSSMQNTGFGLDVAITGEGFLQVMDPDGNIFYTKAGLLDYDSNGYLVDINGNFVLGTTSADGTPSTQKIRLDNVSAVDPRTSSTTEAINGINYTISTSNPTKYGNVSLSIGSSSALPAGLKATATIATTGAITVVLNNSEQFNSMTELNKVINQAIREANNGVETAAGTFTITATENKFGVEASNGTFTGSGDAVKPSLTVGDPSTFFGGKLELGNFDPSNTITADAAFNFTTTVDAADSTMYDISATVEGVTYTGKVSKNAAAGSSVVLKNAAETGSITLNVKDTGLDTVLAAAVTTPQTATVNHGQFFLGGVKITGMSETFPSSGNMTFTVGAMSTDGTGFGLTVAVGGKNYTGTLTYNGTSTLTGPDGSTISLEVPDKATIKKNLCLADTATDTEIHTALDSSKGWHTYSAIAYQAAQTTPLTGAQITGTNFGTITGSITGMDDGVFGGGMTFMKTSSDFSGSGTVASSDFTAKYTADATNPYWTINLSVGGKDYTGQIYSTTTSNSVLLKSDDGDYIQVTNPGFAAMNEEYQTQHPGLTLDSTSSMTAMTGTETLTVTPSEKSREMGLSSVSFGLTGGTAGGAVTLDELTNIALGADGTVSVTHAEKGTIVVGKISLASFANPAGLQLNGTNYYSMSQNSGEPKLCDPGSDGTGSLKSSALEMSNVDLSSEFAEMITTQRGYQANARIITVSDTMLEELINLKR